MTEGLATLLSDIAANWPFFSGFVSGELGWFVAEIVDPKRLPPFKMNAGLLGGAISYVAEKGTSIFRQKTNFTVVMVYLISMLGGIWLNQSNELNREPIPSVGIL